jgi:hypothetical protein
MNQTSLHALQRALRHELQRLDAIHIACKTCKEWEQTGCAKFDVTPPADVQQSGCEEWEFDGVPF